MHAPSKLSAPERDKSDVHGPLLRQGEAQLYLGEKRSTFFAGVASGRLPQPLRPTPRTRVWLKSELDAYIASMAAERRDRRSQPSRCAEALESTDPHRDCAADLDQSGVAR